MPDVLSLDETLYYLKKYREEGDRDALNFLMDKHQNLAYYSLAISDTSCFEFEDAQQLALETLFKTIQQFNYKKYDIKAFSTYVTTSIIRKFNIEKKKLQCKKRNSNSISLDSKIFDSTDVNKNTDLYSIIKNKQEDIEDTVYKKLLILEVKKVINELSDDERKLINLRFFNGDNCRSTRYVGKILGVTRTTILNREKVLFKKLRDNPNIKKWEYKSY